MPMPFEDAPVWATPMRDTSRNFRDGLAIRKWEVREEYNRQAVIILELMCYGIPPRMAMDRLMDYMNGVPDGTEYKQRYEELLALSQRMLTEAKSEIVNLKLENERLKAAATTGEVMPQRRLLTEAEVKPSEALINTPTPPEIVQPFVVPITPIANDQRMIDDMQRVIFRHDDSNRDMDLEDLV